MFLNFNPVEVGARCSACRSSFLTFLFLRILIRQNSRVLRKTWDPGMAEPVYIYDFGELNGRFEKCCDRTGTIFVRMAVD